MSEVGTAYVRILPSTQGFSGAVQGGIAAPMGTAGKKGGKVFGGAMLGAVKPLAGPLAAVFATGAAVGFAKEAYLASEAAVTANARVTQTLENAGEAAGNAAGRQIELAEAISRATGMHDEEIKAGQAILGTFHAVAATAGETGGAFDRATQAAVDLSASGFGSVESASTMLGKALQDPATGMTALTRVGVTFTEQQKEQIKAMQAAGDVAGAQAVILEAVEGQVGGVGEATADASAKMAVGWQNVKESAGDVVAKAFEPIAAFATETLFPALEGVFEFLGGLFNGEGLGDGSGLGDIFASIEDFIRPVLDTFETLKTTVSEAWENFQPTFESIKTAFMEFAENVAPVFIGVFESIRDIASGAMELIGAVVSRVVAVISWVWTNFGEYIMAYLRTVWTIAGNIIGGALDFIKGIISIVTNIIKGDWKAVWESIKDIFRNLWERIKTILRVALDFAKTLLSGAWDFIKRKTSEAWDAVKQYISDKWESIKTSIRNAVENVKTKIRDGFEAAKKSVADKLSAAVRIVSDFPGNALRALGSVSTKLLQAGKDLVQGFINGILAKVRAIPDAIGGAVSGAVNYVKGLLRISSPSKVFMEIGGQVVEGFALGMKDTRPIIKAASTMADSSIVHGGVSAYSAEAAVSPASIPSSRTINIYGPLNEQVERLRRAERHEAILAGVRA